MFHSTQFVQQLVINAHGHIKIPIGLSQRWEDRILGAKPRIMKIICVLCVVCCVMVIGVWERANRGKGIKNGCLLS